VTATPPLPAPPEPAHPVPVPPPPPRPAAPAPVALAALGTGAAAAVLVPGDPPGLGVALFAVLVAGVLLAVRGAVPRPSRWQVVHGTAAVLLVAAAAVRDAGWVVALDLLAAVPLGALALVPARTWAGVLVALPRAGLRVPRSAGALARGLRPLVGRGRSLGPSLCPVVRGLALTALLLVVFVPLLASADERFAALIPAWQLPDLGELPGRAVVGVLAALALVAADWTRRAPGAEPVVPPPSRVLSRASEWLLPLGALDLLLAAFLLAQARPGRGGATFAEELHAGFFQLLAVTALVVLVVAAAVRWTTRSGGVRAALGALCLLTLAVDASALARLHAYTDAYGLTRLRILVGVICCLLAAVLVVLLVAGSRPAPSAPSASSASSAPPAPPASQRWVPHVVVALGALALLGLTAADPDAAIARSALARGPAADTQYLATLSADAVPALLRLPAGQRECVLTSVHSRLERTSGGWTSANASRARAAGLLEAAPPPPARSRAGRPSGSGARGRRRAGRAGR